MDLDLRQIPVAIISLEHQSRRRARAVEMAQALGLQFQIINGIREQPRHKGCSLSHKLAIETLRGSGPFLVLEDDAVPTAAFRPEITLPEEGRLMYLGHSRFGHAGRQLANGTPDLTSTRGAFLQVHSMLAAHAILYPDAAAADMVIKTIDDCLEGRHPQRHDIGLCRLQRREVVLAVPRPWFVQNAEVQGDSKKAQRQDESDYTAQPRKLGDIVTHADQQLQVVAGRHGGLAFAALAAAAG